MQVLNLLHLQKEPNSVDKGKTVNFKKKKMKASLKLTAVFEEVPEGGYISYIEEIAGVNSQGETLDEAKINLAEALEMILDTQRMLSREEQQNKILIRENLEFA